MIDRMGSLRTTLGILALIAAACSGGPAPDAAPSETDVSPSPSTVPLPTADPAALARAMEGLLTRGDLGAPWGEHTAGGKAVTEVRPTSRIGCAFTSGAMDAASVEAAANGAIFQRGDAIRFVSSYVLAFPDEAGAQGAIDAFRGTPWRSCWTDAKTATARSQPGGDESSWRAEPVDRPPSPHETFEGIVRFQYQAIVDGELRDANGHEAVLLYRVGPMVLVVTVEGVAQPSDPRRINRAIDREVDAATGKALARLEASSTG